MADRKAYKAAWYAANKERLAAEGRAYYLAHRVLTNLQPAHAVCNLRKGGR